MFSGIVTARGRVMAVTRHPERLRLRIGAPYPDTAVGESIAVSGVCLTVVQTGDAEFAVDVVNATRQRTRLADLQVGDQVNLERAVAVGDRIGGHLVQGHIDGLGVVEAVRQVEDALLLEVQLPPDVAEITPPRGSVALDGVSLTVSAIPRLGTVEVAVVPYTLEHTSLGTVRVGDRVHVEGDMIGKVVRQLLAARGLPREP